MNHNGDRRLLTQRGWVTTEFALAALGVGLLVVLCVGLFSVGMAQIHCSDAASSIARLTARDDLAAIEMIEKKLPDSAQVSISIEDSLVVVSVAITIEPWGNLLGRVTVNAKASVIHESRGT